MSCTHCGGNGDIQEYAIKFSQVNAKTVNLDLCESCRDTITEERGVTLA